MPLSNPKMSQCLASTCRLSPRPHRGSPRHGRNRWRWHGGRRGWRGSYWTFHRGPPTSVLCRRRDTKLRHHTHRTHRMHRTHYMLRICRSCRTHLHTLRTTRRSRGAADDFGCLHLDGFGCQCGREIGDKWACGLFVSCFLGHLLQAQNRGELVSDFFPACRGLFIDYFCTARNRGKRAGSCLFIGT